MIVLADSGATKTDWCIIGCGGSAVRFRTGGINVSVMQEENIREVLSEALNKIASMSAPLTHNTVTEVHFYAAGLVGEAGMKLEAFLKAVFRNAVVEVDTDLMAAARALWGDRPGIAAILGTGSNSCLYDGERIVRNVRPGGYVLGDEGGGASLGKMLLADFVKGLLPEEIMVKLRETGLDYQIIVKNVYGAANPAAWLASFAPFVFENIDNPYLADMAEDNFRMFVRRSLARYRGVGNAAKASKPLEVGVVGSLGWAGKDILSRVAGEEEVEIVRFLQAPMDGLVEYYKYER